jgi:DNA polymerase
MHCRDLYRSLRLLLEVDQDLGLQFLGRSLPAQPASPEPGRARRPGRAATAPVTPPAVPRPLPIPLVEGGSKGERLDRLAGLIVGCTRCGLCKTRRNAVPGEGSPDTRILFIGEAPGQDEDEQGRPFVGAAGQLLDKMILAMGFPREQVFIANVLKCRPPGNRRPEETEMAACLPFLEQQVDCIRPEVICTLGNTPLKALRPEAAGITRERGQRFDWRGFPVIPTFHPSYLLRNEAAKKPCWADLQLVLKELGLEAPKRR